MKTNDEEKETKLRMMKIKKAKLIIARYENVKKDLYDHVQPVFYDTYHNFRCCNHCAHGKDKYCPIREVIGEFENLSGGAEGFEFCCNQFQAVEQ